MNPKNELTLTVPKWPFFLADGVFVVSAGLLLWFAAGPPGPGTSAAAVLLLLVGALLAVTPYLVEFYWNWQMAASDREEEVELRRQALARTGAEIDQVVRRWEAVREGTSPEALAELSRQLQEAARGFQQSEARIGELEGKVSAEFEKLLRAERAKQKEERLHFDKALARIDALRQALAGQAAAPGNDGGVSPVEKTIPAPPPPKLAQEEAKESGDSADSKTAVSAKTKKPEKPRVRDDKPSLFATTTLVATAFIGASNKLFLRGEGPGLSWDEGVPMQFVEIGKWSWTTTEATQPIRLHVFKNDEEQDKAGVLTIEPGQRLDVRPEFDG